MMLALSFVVAAAYPSVELTGFPFIQQRDDFCGEADVAMAMQRLGHDVSQDQVFALAGVDPAKARGAVTDDLARALRALGVEPGKVWYHPGSKAQVEQQFKALHADLVAGNPSIVCMHYSAEPNTTEHFRLITGYDADTDEVIYQEPAEENGAGRRMKRKLFMDLWEFNPAPDRRTMIRFRLPPPSTKPVIAPETAPTLAEAAQHAIALKETLPKGMTLAWEKPFLVVGDEDPERVRGRAKTIVRWTRDLLLKDLFDEAPSTVHEVWILKDAPSYEKVSKELFNNEPETPYGYYLDERRALVMNIKPGYGTLTHELVHPFMDRAYDDVGEPPPWLNEGVASLFEQPAERDGHMIGNVNWRLPTLKAGLKDKEVPTFKRLVTMNTREFYDDDSGVHYAAARYLCYWLQERGLLAQVVKRTHALRKEDPTGWKALGEVLGKDPETFRADWEKFVGKLTRS